jgi:hypothetical protein
MTEKQITPQEAFNILTGHLTLNYLTSGDLFNGNTRNYDLSTMLEINESFFLRFFATELIQTKPAQKSIFNFEVVDNLQSGVDFLLGVLSQDPRFDVFYTKNQFGKHLFEHHYDNHIDESIQPLLQIDYQQLADYEFDNSNKVFFIYRDKTSLKQQEPTLILALKNEYHDYYDQLN